MKREPCGKKRANSIASLDLSGERAHEQKAEVQIPGARIPATSEPLFFRTSGIRISEFAKTSKLESRYEPQFRTSIGILKICDPPLVPPPVRCRTRVHCARVVARHRE